MIDLSKMSGASPEIQTVQADPGRSWERPAVLAIDAPPDDETDPQPDARWPADAVRTGVCGSVTPRVVTLRDGGYRMYYTQILPRVGFPAGANDYDNASTRILSAVSSDGETWTPEPGVRLSPRDGGAGEFRVVCGDVVPREDLSGGLRMYYECCTGSQAVSNTIRSAISEDGLVWSMETGDRYSGGAFSSPRIVFLENGQCRLYFYKRGLGIISALSIDGGLTFSEDQGVRILPGKVYAAFAPEIIRLSGGGYVMYYAGYKGPREAYILRATSEDGLVWHKENTPTISPDPGTWDGTKCSEMCVFPLSPQIDRQDQRYRMVYEACDGTAIDRRGVWRIVSVTSISGMST